MGNKKIIKKEIFPLNNQCPLVSCFLHTSHLLWPYIASYPWLLKVIPTRNVQDKTFEQHSNCKGLEKAIPLLLPLAVSITDFYSVTLPIPVHVQSGTAAEMWDEELTWEFLFPYPAHYLQQSKGFIVLFLSLLFNTARSTRNFKRKESSWRNRDFTLGLPRSIEQFALKNRLLLSLNYHMQ